MIDQQQIIREVCDILVSTEWTREELKHDNIKEIQKELLNSKEMINAQEMNIVQFMTKYHALSNFWLKYGSSIVDQRIFVNYFCAYILGKFFNHEEQYLKLILELRDAQMLPVPFDLISKVITVFIDHISDSIIETI